MRLSSPQTEAKDVSVKLSKNSLLFPTELFI